MGPSWCQSAGHGGQQLEACQQEVRDRETRPPDGVLGTERQGGPNTALLGLPVISSMVKGEGGTPELGQDAKSSSGEQMARCFCVHKEERVPSPEWPSSPACSFGMEGSTGHAECVDPEGRLEPSCAALRTQSFTSQACPDLRRAVPSPSASSVRFSRWDSKALCCLGRSLGPVAVFGSLQAQARIG